MAFIFDIVQRLEADPNGDLARGFAAETADPLWLIGRAWQMCEHEGEDASSRSVPRTSVARRRSTRSTAT